MTCELCEGGHQATDYEGEMMHYLPASDEFVSCTLSKPYRKRPMPRRPKTIHDLLGYHTGRAWRSRKVTVHKSKGMTFAAALALRMTDETPPLVSNEIEAAITRLTSKEMG